MKTTTIVALVGKVGHGKTFLLNKVTGKHYPSNAGASSCTRTLQFGFSNKQDMLVVDTPGFYVSDNLAQHLAAQKVALEGHPLSGVFFVVKYGRADEIALEAARVIEFVGDDNIRIIITHSDRVNSDPGYDPEALVARLSNLIAVPASSIKVVGKTTTASSIEKFMASTLHAPKEFKVSMEQTTEMSSLCVCARRFDKAIRALEAKISAASLECNDMVSNYGRKHEVDMAIIVIQKTTSDAVQSTKEEIFREAEDLPDDQKHTIYGKAGLALTLRLKVFVEATNKLLSWDVTNASDARNSYKSCPHCGAIFIKTEGCDGETVCGAVPSSVSTERPRLDAGFQKSKGGWKVQYYWDGCHDVFPSIFRKLCSLRQVKYHSEHLSGEKTKRAGLNMQSGCGARVNWSTMNPIDPAMLVALGNVELQQEGEKEVKSKTSFTAAMQKYQSDNTKRFRDAIFG